MIWSHVQIDDSLIVRTFWLLSISPSCRCKSISSRNPEYCTFLGNVATLLTEVELSRKKWNCILFFLWKVMLLHSLLPVLKLKKLDYFQIVLSFGNRYQLKHLKAVWQISKGQCSHQRWIINRPSFKQPSRWHHFKKKFCVDLFLLITESWTGSHMTQSFFIEHIILSRTHV